MTQEKQYRPSKAQWHDAGERWRLDPFLTLDDVSTELKVSIPAVSKYFARKGWQKEPSLVEIVRRGSPPPPLPNTVEAVEYNSEGAGEFIPAAAHDRPARPARQVDRTDEVLARHIQDIEPIRKMLEKGVSNEDMGLLRCAKTAAETLKIQHSAERAAHRIDDVNEPVKITIRRTSEGF